LQSARDQQIRALLRATLTRPAAERVSFVAELAGGDDALRRSVEALLERGDATMPGDGAAEVHDEPQELPAGTLLGGHYRIDGVLGRGGMGVVYRATDTKLSRPVAIKLVSAALADPAASQRFRIEAQTASSLNHPHIVTVHDVGEHAGTQYIVSELIDGGTLEDWAAATGRRGWRQSVELVIGVADALSAAHAAQVLHRDVKPSNILIGANGYAKLTDFGLAKLVEPKDAALSRVAGVTRPGVVVGTVAYMSPEQVAGLPLDARSDVFSFGIVLYELLAGRRPFEGATDLETLKSIAQATPDPLPDGTPEALRIAVDKALEKEPADRYQTMRELVVDLRRVVRKSGSSQTALASSDARIVAGVVKRNPMAAVAALAAVVVLVAGAMYGVLGPNTSRLATPLTSRSYEIVQLTTTGQAMTAAISRDGRFVVYAQRENGGTLPNALWTRQIGTSSRGVRIVDPDPQINVLAPTVTPDGDFVDFIRQDSGTILDVDLVRVPRLGDGPPQPIAENVWGPVGWAPDGRRMAFVRFAFDTQASSLVVANADGSNQQTLARRAAPVVFPVLGLQGRGLLVRPAWSPDGRTIAMFEFNLQQPGARVVFIDVASHSETSRDAHAAAPALEGLAWLGPTSLVLSQADSVGRGTQLWRMSYPDGVVTPLTNDLSSYLGVDVDEQRRNLVTTRREQRIAVYIDTAGGDTQEVAAPVPSGAATTNIVWGGERLIYDSSVNGRPSIAAVPVNGGDPVYVAEDAYSAAATSDGSTIVFARNGVSGLWLADGRGGPQRQLIEGDATSPLVLPNDDRTVLFVSTRSGKRSLWSAPIDGSEPPKLFVDIELVPNNAFDVSRDGRRLLFLDLADPQFVVVCDLPDCTARSRHELPDTFDALLRWTPDGNRIAYRDRLARNLWTIPLDGGEPRPLPAFPNATSDITVGYAWSRDGTRLARLGRTFSDDIVLLRNLSE
jgi:Tol biopolymer transport system component